MAALNINAQILNLKHDGRLSRSQTDTAIKCATDELNVFIPTSNAM
jgi:hypothetical protein